MNWYIALNIKDKEKLEIRIEKILAYLIDSNKNYRYDISDIDATGEIGNNLTEKLNSGENKMMIDKNKLLNMLREDGQIFELDLLVSGKQDNFRFLIRDGYFVDVSGDKKKLPSNILGDHRDLETGLFENL